MDDILRRVIEIARRHVDPEHARALEDPTTALSAAGLDSLGRVGLLVELESAFSIRFPEEMLRAECFSDLQTTAGSVRRALEGVPPHPPATR